MLKLYLFRSAGLQHGIVHTGCPFGLPLNVTTLPQKLKEAGEKYLDLRTRNIICRVLGGVLVMRDFVKREFTKLFFVTRDLKVLRDP